MSDDKKTVSELWVELKATMEALEKDVMKNTEKSNVSAGVRLRKGVRALRAVGAELIRSTTQADKDLKEKRKAEKAAKKAAETPTEWSIIFNYFYATDISGYVQQNIAALFLYSLYFIHSYCFQIN